MSKPGTIVFKRLAIVGIGLMGGSLALAARAAGAVEHIAGFSRRQSTLDTALAEGVIDTAHTSLAEVVAGADCVVVATPTILAEQMMIDVLELVDEHTVVTDVASVKGNLERAITDRFAAMPDNVVLGHPIAGSEQSGVAAARVDLYRDHCVILIESATNARAQQANAAVEALWQAVGARVVQLGCADHDRALALTSHLPHLLAYALLGQMLGEDDPDNALRFAAGGFRDFTRIASSDPVMWREIMLANREQLLQSLAAYQQQLQDIAAALTDGDGEQLEQLFAQAKALRDSKIR